MASKSYTHFAALLVLVSSITSSHCAAADARPALHQIAARWCWYPPSWPAHQKKGRAFFSITPPADARPALPAANKKSRFFSLPSSDFCPFFYAYHDSANSPPRQAARLALFRFFSAKNSKFQGVSFRRPAAGVVVIMPYCIHGGIVCVFVCTPPPAGAFALF